MSFLLVIHVTFCILLIIIILIQAGRGGGLVDSFSGVESMFGTKTSALLTKMTTIFASLFFICCLSLAILSARQSKSLMRNVKEEKTPLKTSSGQNEKPAAVTETSKTTEAPKTEETQKTAIEETLPEKQVPGTAQEEKTETEAVKDQSKIEEDTDKDKDKTKIKKEKTPDNKKTK